MGTMNKTKAITTMRINSRTSKRRRSFSERVDEIHTKAAMLFAQNGYLNTSMNHVAKVANLKKGGLYHYIKNKETLLFEILDRTLDIFLERGADLRLEGLSPERKLERLIREYTMTLVRYHNEVTLIVLASKYLRPKFRNIVQSKRMRYEELFYSIIHEGLSQATFVEHDDKDTLGFLVLGGIFNYYLWHPMELEGDVEKKIQGFTRFFLNGLLAR